MLKRVGRVAALIGLLVGLLFKVAFAVPLPAHEAFQFRLNLVDPNTFQLEWQMAPGYFLYQDKISISPLKKDSLDLAPLRLPSAQTYTDKLGAVHAVYRNKLRLQVGVVGLHPGEALVGVDYQGCSLEGYCYPKETRLVKLSFNPNRALYQATLEPRDLGVEAEGEVALAHDSDPQALFTLLSFFGLGLLLAFTPCVLPMVPVLSGLIVGHGDKITTRKAFLLSLVYVLSMSITYALMGALVALVGQNLQMMLQSTISIALFAGLFFILALSMFGVYEFKLPAFFQQKIANFSRAHATGHYLGTAMMGALSILILSPCVTPPLIAALGLIAHSGQLAFGMLALFFMGLGMGTPLLLVGLSAGRLLPKSGEWMNTIKAFFGVMMLGLSIFLLGRILPPYLGMLLWASLFVVTAVFIGAFEAPYDAFSRFKKALGLMLFIYGLLILIGAAIGHDDPLRPLAKEQGQAIASTTPETVRTMVELQDALISAKGKPVILDFFADWCSSCKAIERTVLQSQKVLSLLQGIKLIRVDVTANDAPARAMLKRFAVVAPPTFIFINAEGQVLSQRLVGEIDASAFISALKSFDERILSGT